MRPVSAQIEQFSVVWVLVADGGRATIYRYHKNMNIMPMHESRSRSSGQEMTRHELTLVPGMEFKVGSSGNLTTSHDASGAPTASKKPGYNTREQHPNLHDEVKQQLVAEVAMILKQAVETQAFDHLVIAAPPKILGALRQHLDNGVLTRIVAEINKDFTNDSNHALLAHLQKTLTESMAA